MRTTVTLDADTEALLRRRMRERGISFKQALNDAVRTALSDPGDSESFRTEVHSMGRPRADLDKALTLAGELEDEEILRKLRARK